MTTSAALAPARAREGVPMSRRLARFGLGLVLATAVAAAMAEQWAGPVTT